MRINSDPPIKEVLTMRFRFVVLLSAILLAFSFSFEQAQAEAITGQDLVKFMKVKPKMTFKAGSRANFGKKSGNTGIGGFTMKHGNGPTLKGTFTVDLHGWVDMIYSDGSRHRFKVEKLKPGSPYPYKLTYTKGPYRGKSFEFR